MKVSDLDRGFVPETDITEEDIIWIDVKTAPIVISGVFFDEEQGQFVRMPQDVADSVHSMVSFLNRNTAGGRVRFRTDSAYIAMYTVMYNDDEEHFMTQMQHGFDLCHKNDSLSQSTYAYSFVPPTTMKKGFSQGFFTDKVMEDFTLHMPTLGDVRELYIGLKRDAIIEAPTPYKHEKPVVFYGSSITQGSCSSRPANIYEAIISRHLDTEFIDLGFSGSALGEQEIIRHIAELDMSIFVCDYDHNASSADHLWKTHLPVYRTVREKNPDLPIVFITAPNIMPDYTWHMERREAIRATYETALSEGDQNVYFIDGETFFDIADRDMCTVDTCHPNDLGMYLMATKIEKVLKEILEK